MPIWEAFEMTHTYCVIHTSTSSADEAQRLAAMLVSQGLAACVQVFMMDSVYTWQGELHQEPEWLLQIKTRADLYPQVEKALLAHHSYETPEILCMPVIQGSDAYLAWLDASTSTEGRG
jgi:periplasmic divalent cation tolerance protein